MKWSGWGRLLNVALHPNLLWKWRWNFIQMVISLVMSNNEMTTQWIWGFVWQHQSKIAPEKKPYGVFCWEIVKGFSRPRCHSLFKLPTWLFEPHCLRTTALCSSPNVDPCLRACPHHLLPPIWSFCLQTLPSPIFFPSATRDTFQSYLLLSSD